MEYKLEKQKDDSGEWDDVPSSSQSQDDDSDWENWDKDSSQDVYDPCIFPGIITKEVIQALEAANKPMKLQRNLKELCIHTIIYNKNFFLLRNEKISLGNPLLKLPECLLELLREALVDNKKAMGTLGYIFFSLLIHPSTTTSVRFDGGSLSYVPQERENWIFWKKIQESSNLQQLSFLGKNTPDNILGLISHLEKLQIINIPSLKCNDGHLEFIATHFLLLQELTVNLSEKDISVQGAKALSGLKRLKKFVFKMLWFTIDTQEMVVAFMKSCLQLMPSLQRLGIGTTLKPDMMLWVCCHPLQLLQQPGEFALEALVLDQTCSLPETTLLPNLRELYLNKPRDDFVHVIGKFENLIHLCVTTRSKFGLVEKILKAVGAKLKNLSLTEEHGEICLSTVLTLCPKVETLVVSGRPKKKTLRGPFKMELKLTELKLYLYSGAWYMEDMTIQNSALTDIFLHSNSTLRVLHLSYVHINMQEAQHLARLVEQKLIFTNLEEIQFENSPSQAVLTLLAQCALDCLKIKSIKVPMENGKDLFAYNVSAFARRNTLQ